MRRLILLLILALAYLTNYGQIIADHTVVSQYTKIPQTYIDEIKKMWVVVPGESHSESYRTGMTLLESSYPTFAVSTVDYGTPEAYTTSHLRISRGTWGDYSNSSGWVYSYGEEDWWTNSTAIARTKAGITYCNTHSLTIAAMGFGWCWDAVGHDHVSSGVDPVTGNHWYGWSVGSPSGDGAWGIDDADNTISGNSVNMDDYLAATQSYIDYCAANSIATKIFFTTGPVDNVEGYAPDEDMYQGYLKYEHIRNYVKANSSRILFDFADILSYDDNGTLTTKTWNGHTFPSITATNLSPAEAYHFSQAGAIRIAKAMWWLLARIAGWDGITTDVVDNKADEPIKVLTNNSSYEIRVHVPDSYISGNIILFNLHGGLIENKVIDSNDCILNRANVAPGMYIINVSKSKLTQSKKIVLVN
jgi:hypothetical protein